MTQKSFGEWLRHTRESRGLSVRGLAEKAGITHPTISQIENQKTGATREMVRKLAAGLEVPVSDAIRAWLEDDEQEGGAIFYISNPETARVAEVFESLPRQLQGNVKGLILSIAGITQQTGRQDVTIDADGNAVTSEGDFEELVRNHEAEFTEDHGGHASQIGTTAPLPDANKD